jgi:hypothetical protein
MWTALVLLLVGHRIAGTPGAIGVTCLLVAMPLGWYWSAHLNFELPCLALAATFLYLELFARDLRGRHVLAFACLALAFWFDLVALFAAGALVIERVLFRPRRGKLALAVAAAAVTLLAGWWWWKGHQLGRHGQSYPGGVLQHLVQVSFLSPEFSWREWIPTVSLHLLRLCAFWPLLFLLVGPLVALRTRATPAEGDAGLPAEWPRWFRTTLLLAILAWLVPAQRSFDHPFYTHYFLLPVCAAVLPLLRGPRCAGRLAILAVISLATLLWSRPAPPVLASVPSGHLLGRELAAAVADPEAVIAIPADAPFYPIVLTYYAGQPVVKLLPGDPYGAELRRTQLVAFGLADRRLVRAEGSRWPGRDGFTDLP